MDSNIHPTTPFSIAAILSAHIFYSLTIIFPSVEVVLKTLSVISVCMVIIINIKPFYKAIKEHKKNFVNYIKSKLK